MKQAQKASGIREIKSKGSPPLIKIRVSEPSRGRVKDFVNVLSLITFFGFLKIVK